MTKTTSEAITQAKPTHRARQANMSQKKRPEAQDELFFDQLKDQFAFFYAATVTAMEAYKKLRADYQKKAKNHSD